MQAAQQQENIKTATSQSTNQSNTADPTSQPSGNTTTSQAPLNQVFFNLFRNMEIISFPSDHSDGSLKQSG